jgi:hypothetical protein
MHKETLQNILKHGMDYHFQEQQLASTDDIQAFENEYEKIHPDYLSYLTEVGFPTVGAESFDRIAELKEVRQRLGKSTKDWGLPDEGKTKECFVFHWDGSGNPVGISWNDRKVYVDDHDFGLGILLGENIDEYVASLLNEE